MVLEFFDQNLAESRIAHDRTFKDARVRALLDQNFIEYVIELGQHPDWERKYQVQRFPTVILVDFSGTEIDRMSGAFFPQTLVSALSSAKTGNSELLELKAAAGAPASRVAAHRALAHALMLRGAQVEALTEYIWCLKQGPVADPEGYRASLNSILVQIDILSRRLPEASKVLEEQRQWVQQRVKLDDPASLQAAFEFNETQRAPEENLKLYDRFPAGSPLRNEYFNRIFGEMVRQRRYADAVAVLDLESYINANYPMELEDGAKLENPSVQERKLRESMLARRKQRISNLTAWAVEALIGTDKLEKAKRISGRAMEEIPTRDLKISLAHAANRAATSSSNDFIAWLESQDAPRAAKSQ